MKLDHLNLPVSSLDRSRDWYVATLGLKVEFEIAASRTVSLQDGEGFAIFLQEKPGATSNGTALWVQVDDVDAIFAEWTARGVAFNHGPQKNFWGYGPDSSTRTAISCACGTSARCARNRHSGVS